jgi:deoxyribodipyrimidine photolyase-related protein
MVMGTITIFCADHCETPAAWPSTALRHFAAELHERGWSVDYHDLDDGFTFDSAARAHCEKHRPEKFLLAEPNSFFETDALIKLGRKLRLPVEFLPTNQFLVPRADFIAWAKDSRHLLMENLPPHAEALRVSHEAGWQARGRRVEF